MGSISFQVVGDASVGTKSRTFQVPDAHINRLVEAMKPFGAQPATATTALIYWAQMVMDKTKDAVMERERAAAAQAVAPITAT
jgi:hypothetical protein